MKEEEKKTVYFVNKTIIFIVADINGDEKKRVRNKITMKKVISLGNSNSQCYLLRTEEDSSK